jgi:hypothetical protein
MENNNDHPFERYFREQMRGLRKSPSGDVWERIAARQTATKPWNRFRRLWIGAGVCAGVAAFVFFGLNKRRENNKKMLDYQAIVSKDSLSILKTTDARTAAEEGIKRISQARPDDMNNRLSRFQKSEKPTPRPSSAPAPRVQNPIQKTLNEAIRVNPRPSVAQKEKQEKQLKNPGRTNTDPNVNAPEFRLSQTETTPTAMLPQDPDPGNAANQQMDAQTKGGIESHTAGRTDQSPTGLFQLPPRSRLFPAWRPAGLRAPLEMAPTPRIEPQREKRLYYGLALSVGRLATDGAWQGTYHNLGVNLQYRISTRFYLFGGLEWMKGQKQFASDPFGKAAWFQAERFPHLPPQPPTPPAPPFDNFHLDSDWSGIAAPLGATLYGDLPWHRPKWLLRAYYKPHFALQRQNRLVYPFSPSDNLQFSDGQAEFRSGWIGAQAGASGRVLKRWQAELTLTAEYALAPVNLEQVNYQSFALRLALFRLHK